MIHPFPWSPKVLLVCLLTFAPSAGAAPSKPSVEAVLEFYRTEDFLAEGYDHFDQALKRRAKALGKAKVKHLRGLAKRIYPAKNLYDVFKVAYAKAITLEAMTALYQWQVSPVGIRIRQAFAQAYPAKPRQRQAYFDRESPALLKANRKNALETYTETTEQAKVLPSWQVGAELAVILAADAYRPASERPKLEEVEEKLRARKTALLFEGQKAAQVFTFYLLRQLKNEEIDQLSKLATTPAGQAHTTAFLKSLDETLKAAALTLRDQVAKDTP